MQSYHFLPKVGHMHTSECMCVQCYQHRKHTKLLSILLICEDDIILYSPNTFWRWQLCLRTCFHCIHNALIKNLWVKMHKLTHLINGVPGISCQYVPWTFFASKQDSHCFFFFFMFYLWSSFLLIHGEDDSLQLHRSSFAPDPVRKKIIIFSLTSQTHFF